MRKLAIIFDVYGTLLQVGPAPPEADAGWARLWSELLGCTPGMSRLEFSVRCDRIIRERHEQARQRGILYPEINWPSVVAQVVPELADLPGQRAHAFGSHFMELGRTIALAPGCAEFLRWASEQALLGIASNAQAYTLTELETALKAHALDLALFQPELCFWSYQHGFSKPDPHVFQILASRLEVLGISTKEAWMIGDRPDNDIEPALRQGWQAWLVGPEPERGWTACRMHLTRGESGAIGFQSA